MFPLGSHQRGVWFLQSRQSSKQAERCAVCNRSPARQAKVAVSEQKQTICHACHLVPRGASRPGTREALNTRRWGLPSSLLELTVKELPLLVSRSLPGGWLFAGEGCEQGPEHCRKYHGHRPVDGMTPG
jgi:hypothetical protein